MTTVETEIHDFGVQTIKLRSVMIRTIARSEKRSIREVCEVRNGEGDTSRLMASQLLDGVQLAMEVEPTGSTDSGMLSMVLTADEADNLALILKHLVAEIRCPAQQAGLTRRNASIGFKG